MRLASDSYPEYRLGSIETEVTITLQHILTLKFARISTDEHRLLSNSSEIRCSSNRSRNSDGNSVATPSTLLSHYPRYNRRDLVLKQSSLFAVSTD